MKNILTIIFSVFVTAGFAQNDTTVTYFKDFDRTKEVEANKGKFLERKIAFPNDSLYVEVVYLKTNKIYLIENYKNGSPAGIWRVTNSKGIPQGEYNYDKLVYSVEKVEGGHYFDFNGEAPKGFTAPVCEDLYNKLGPHSKYPSLAKDLGIQGTVALHVKIDSSGKLTVLSVYKGVHVSLDQATVETFEHSPIWQPATKNGEAIDSYLIMKFTYKLS
jgi:TonB family protein